MDTLPHIDLWEQHEKQQSLPDPTTVAQTLDSMLDRIDVERLKLMGLVLDVEPFRVAGGDLGEIYFRITALLHDLDQARSAVHKAYRRRKS